MASAAKDGESPIVLQGLIEMHRKGLGWIAGWKHMHCTLYTTGDLILAEEDTPAVPAFKVAIADKERSKHHVDGHGVEKELVIMARSVREGPWEDEHRLRAPRDDGGLFLGPGVSNWLDAIQKATAVAKASEVSPLLYDHHRYSCHTHVYVFCLYSSSMPLY